MSFARWQPYYTDRELELDRRIHAFGLLLALIATPLLLGLAAESRRPGLVLPCAIYLLSLLGMLGSSTLFRHTPLRWSNYRWFLRRLDHAAIFLFIAGTYTPFTVGQMHGERVGAMVAVWAGALIGAAYKLAFPVGLRRRSLVACRLSLVSSRAPVLPQPAETAALTGRALVRALWPALESCMARRKGSADHEEAWLILAGFLLRPGFGAAADHVRIDSLWRLREQGLYFAGKRSKVQEYLLWRRVAGGLEGQRQEQILAPELDKIRTQKKVAPELIRLAGSLERLPIQTKTELANLFIDASSNLAREDKRDVQAFGHLDRDVLALIGIDAGELDQVALLLLRPGDRRVLRRVDRVVHHAVPLQARHGGLLGAADGDQADLAGHRAKEVAFGLCQGSMKGCHDGGLEPSLGRDQNAGEPRVVVDDVEGAAANRLVGAI